MSESYETKCLGARFSSFRFSGFLSIVTFIYVSLVSPNNIYAVDVTLAWDANNEPHVDGYKIFYRQRDDVYNYNHPDWVGSRSETACTIYGLDADATYYFVVRAVDVEGNESADSNEVCYQPNLASRQVMTDNSDTSGGGGGCFIASTVFGSPLEARIGILKGQLPQAKPGVIAYNIFRGRLWSFLLIAIATAPYFFH